MLAGSVRGGVLSYTLGVILANTLLEVHKTDPTLRVPQFTHDLTTWCRLTGSDEVIMVLFDQGREIQSLFSHLVS